MMACTKAPRKPNPRDVIGSRPSVAGGMALHNHLGHTNRQWDPAKMSLHRRWEDFEHLPPDWNELRGGRGLCAGLT